VEAIFFLLLRWGRVEAGEVRGCVTGTLLSFEFLDFSTSNSDQILGNKQTNPTKTL
jgi:hypothetical protein